MTDSFEFTLDNPLTEEQWDMIADVDFDHTDRIWFHTKHGKEVEFTKVIRCKECKYYSCGTVEGKHLCMSVKYRFTPTAEDEWCSRAERKEE